MNHPEIEELLSAWVDGELTPAQQEVVDLHLAGCADCQRALAEFRLTRQQLALLADPIIATTWQPNVVQHVTARIRRRHHWLGLGQRLALDAAGALAVGLVVAAAVWLLPRLNLSSDDAMSGTAPSRTARQPTLVSPEPVNATDIALAAPGSGSSLMIVSADLRGSLAPDAVQNLVFQLTLDEKTPAEDVFIVLEGPDGAQILLDPAQAPSIPVPAGVRAGDALRLFLWLRGGDHSPVAEFTLDRDVDQSWLAVNPRQIDAAPSLRVALPQLDTPQPTFMALQAPDDQFALYLLDVDALQDTLASDAVRNLGYRMSVSGLFVIVEIVGGEQIILDPAQAPSIHLPAGAQAGDRVRLFATTNVATPAAEFTLASTKEGWQALDLRRSSTPAELRVKLPTPTPQVVDASSPGLPFSSVAEGPEVVLRLERLYVTPEQPFQGQPLTVTAVIRNAGDVDAARVTAWFGAHSYWDDASTVSASTDQAIIPAGEEIELIWGGEWWGGYNLIDLSRESSRLTLRASVNVVPPGGLHYSLLPEADKSDNVAEITVDFLPYQLRVSDACPPGDNLRLEPGQAQISQSYPWQEALPIVVHNDGNVEVTRVPLRVTDAEGRRFLTYARWVQPCGGTTEGNAVLSAGPFTYPITVTLNPSDVPDALPESERGDNVVVVSAGEVCTGTTDLWLTADDVAFEGDDLLVTVHLSGSPPSRSFWLRVYHTADGSVIANQQVSGLTAWPCDEPRTMRFEGALAGLNDGVLMVQIDTESSRIESVYPQNNNAATAPLP